MNNMKLNKNKKGIGFFIALGICILAVGIASFTTYNSIKNFTNSEKYNTAKTQSDIVDQNVTNELESTLPDDSFSMYSTSSKNVEDTPKTAANEVTHDSDDSIETRSESSGLIVYPAGKEIIKNYSDNNPVYSKTMGDWRAHNGIDFKCEQGSKVQAITDGVVKEIYDDGLYGMTVVIDHSNDFTAYYSGLGNTTLVKSGDNIEAGQEIGSINDVPCESQDGFHLHFAVKKDGNFINPTEVLGSIN